MSCDKYYEGGEINLTNSVHRYGVIQIPDAPLRSSFEITDKCKIFPKFLTTKCSKYLHDNLLGRLKNLLNIAFKCSKLTTL